MPYIGSWPRDGLAGVIRVEVGGAGCTSTSCMECRRASSRACMAPPQPWKPPSGPGAPACASRQQPALQPAPWATAAAAAAAAQRPAASSAPPCMATVETTPTPCACTPRHNDDTVSVCMRASSRVASELWPMLWTTKTVNEAWGSVCIYIYVRFRMVGWRPARESCCCWAPAASVHRAAVAPHLLPCWFVRHGWCS